MNPCYYQYEPILQQRYYAYGVHVSPVPAHWVVHDRVIPIHHHTMGLFYNPPSLQYVDDVAILNTPNDNNNNTMWVNQQPMHSYQPPEEFEVFLEERLIMHELGLVDRALQRPSAGTSGSGSGLSEEEISKRLHVHRAQGKMSADCEADTCSICLGEYENKEKTGRLDCGHRYHAECIKRWLSSKNVCPMCRSTALTV